MDIKIPGISNIVALVLLLAGALSPGWMVFENLSGFTVHVGLFYITGIDEYNNTAMVGFLEFQVEVIIGIILCFVSVIFTFVYGNGERGHTSSFLIPPIVMDLIAGIITWVACGRFLHATLVLDSADMEMGVPYSIIISGLGGILCIIVMVMLIVKKSSGSTNVQSSQGVVFNQQPAYNIGYINDGSMNQDYRQKHVVYRLS